MARYGHQPLSEILAMPRSEFRLFFQALCEIVREENGTTDEDDA